LYQFNYYVTAVLDSLVFGVLAESAPFAGVGTLVSAPGRGAALSAAFRDRVDLSVGEGESGQN
jgi:hypothetical protein